MLSVDLNGRVIYWDPLAVARRAGAALCFAHASAVPAPAGWVVCDRRGPSPVILLPPVRSPMPQPADSSEHAAVSWFEPEGGQPPSLESRWCGGEELDDDHTIVVPARRAARTRIDLRPPTVDLTEAKSEAADQRWDLDHPSADDEPKIGVIETDRSLEPASDGTQARPAIRQIPEPVGRPWWATVDGESDAALKPGPDTPLLKRAFRGGGTRAPSVSSRRRYASTDSRSHVDTSSVGWLGAAETYSDDDVTGSVPGAVATLPPRSIRSSVRP